jgi:hypothetical protein
MVKLEEWRRTVEEATRPTRTEEFTAETVPSERLEEPADDLTYIHKPPRRELRLLRSRPKEVNVTKVDLGRTPLTVSLPAPVQVDSSVEPNYLRHSFKGFTVYWAERIRIPVGMTPEGEVITEERDEFLARRTYLTCRREKEGIHCRSVAGPPYSLPLEEWLARR